MSINQLDEFLPFPLNKTKEIVTESKFWGNLILMKNGLKFYKNDINFYYRINFDLPIDVFQNIEKTQLIEELVKFNHKFQIYDTFYKITDLGISFLEICKPELIENENAYIQSEFDKIIITIFLKKDIKKIEIKTDKTQKKDTKGELSIDSQILIKMLLNNSETKFNIIRSFPNLSNNKSHLRYYFPVDKKNTLIIEKPESTYYDLLFVYIRSVLERIEKEIEIKLNWETSKLDEYNLSNFFLSGEEHY